MAGQIDLLNQIIAYRTKDPASGKQINIRIRQDQLHLLPREGESIAIKGSGFSGVQVEIIGRVSDVHHNVGVNLELESMIIGIEIIIDESASSLPNKLKL